MQRIFAFAVLFLFESFTSAGQTFTPQDVANNPEFKPNRIYAHLFQGEWLLKRQEFQKVLGQVVLCKTEYFSRQEIGYTTKVLGVVHEDPTFCSMIPEQFEATNDIDLVSIIIVEVDKSLEKRLKGPRDFEPPTTNVKLLGYRYGQEDCGNKTFMYDEVVNRLVCEIYSLKHIAGFLGTMKKQ